jgi:DNA repair protein SbcD/Mre11
MAIRMLAFGDLHLGRSASAVHGDPPEASTKFTWNRLVDHAIGNDIDALLLLGDIVDQDNRYFEAVGPLLSGFEKLGRQGIQVYLVSGNHDYEVLAQIAGTQGDSLQGEQAGNVHLLGRAGKWEMKTFQKEDLSLQIAGWSFPGRHVPGSPMQDFHEVSRKRDPDRPLIGLLHCDVDVRESPYAPVSLNELIHTDADAWLLGHVHKPGALNVSDPAIWYSGSPHAPCW